MSTEADVSKGIVQRQKDQPVLFLVPPLAQRRDKEPPERGSSTRFRARTPRGVPAPRDLAPARIHLSVVQAVSVLSISGETTFEAEAACWQAVRKVIRRRTPYLVIDLDRATVSPDTLLLLHSMTTFCARHGLTAVLTASSHSVRRFLQPLVNDHVRLGDATQRAIAQLLSQSSD